MKKTILFLFGVLILFISSCESKRNDEIVLLLDKSESILFEDTQYLFAFDSIVFLYTDSISVYRHFPTLCFENAYYEINDNVYQYVDIHHPFNEEIIRQDTILTFSLKDTSFVYLRSSEILASYLDYSYASSKFDIKGDGFGNRMTIKQSLEEPTYKEIYHYDKNFKMSKIIYTYQDKKCVYVPKK